MQTLGYIKTFAYGISEKTIDENEKTNQKMF